MEKIAHRRRVCAAVKPIYRSKIRICDIECSQSSVSSNLTWKGWLLYRPKWALGGHCYVLMYCSKVEFIYSSPQSTSLLSLCPFKCLPPYWFPQQNKVHLNKLIFYYIILYSIGWMWHSPTKKNKSTSLHWLLEHCCIFKLALVSVCALILLDQSAEFNMIDHHILYNGDWNI